MQPRLLTIPSAFALIFASCTASVYAQGIITTIAGGSQFQVTGVGGPAINVPLGPIGGVATDAQGNVYASDPNSSFIYRITPVGVLTLAAGRGGTFNRVAVSQPITVDASGNLFFVAGCGVTKIDSAGTMSTVVGNNGCGAYSGDGGPASQASLNGPRGIAVDAGGNLYIADTTNDRVRKVNPQGIITTVAGNGTCCFTGDGVPATNTALNSPYAVMVDSHGVLYIADTYNARIRRVGADGIITTIAGGNGRGFSGDGGPALAARFDWPVALAEESSGAIDIVDMNNQRIRRIALDGMIQTIAGTGVASFTGDGGPASLAALNTPLGVSTDSSGNVYIADASNFRVRKVDPSGTITTFAGNGDYGVGADGGQARQAVLNAPTGVLVDPAGNVYVADTNNDRVRKITPDGVITTIAGGEARGYAGDGGPAVQALLNGPSGLAFDSVGNLYIADSRNERVRKIDLNGIITTFAGNGNFPSDPNGDGGPAINASFYPSDVAFDGYGNLYIADTFNSAIRRVSPDGKISTLARAISDVGSPGSVAVDAAGNIYSSIFSALARPGSGGTLVRISPNGANISTVTTFTGSPGKIAFDSQGNFYMSGRSGVTLVSPSGAQTVVAGTTSPGFSGDDGPATLAQLNLPTALALDSAGNLYLADTGNNRIRKVFLNPASGLFQPTLQTTLQPGFYIAAVTLGRGELPGYWGMQVLAPAGVLAGGFYLGGAIRQANELPGFGAFYLPTPQTLHVHVDAQAAGGGSSSTVALGVQLLDASRNPVIGQQFGGTSVDFTQPLSAGFYIVAVNGGANSTNENFQMALSAPNLTGGVVVGGFAVPNSVGFGAFDLTVAQQVTIQVFGQPSFGAAGAGGLRLTLYDASRSVIASVP